MDIPVTKVRYMRKNTYQALVEALRRLTRFHAGCPILKAWTGLGHKTFYRDAIEGGYMAWADGSGPRGPYAGWLVLTPRGAGIIEAWLGMGFNFAKIEANMLPPIPAANDAKTHCGASNCWVEK